jgi:hypothetical protein
MRLDMPSRPSLGVAPVLSRLRSLPVGGQATPARLLRLGAVLVLGCLVTALVSLVSGLNRQVATDEGNGRVSALVVDSAELYRSLADADAMATSGYVAGSAQPAAPRARYDTDLDLAVRRLVHVGGELAPGDPARPLVTQVVTELPEYLELIETARTYNRLDLPLGQSYLGAGSRLMRETVLPTVEQLRRQQTGVLASDYGEAGAFPFAVLLLGAATLAGLLDAAVAERRRTNRVVNPGLVGGVALLLVALLWWVGAMLFADFRFSSASRHATSVTALDDARTAVLQARSNESLVLVARNDPGASDTGFTGQLDQVLGTDVRLADRSSAGLLAAASDSAGSEGSAAVEAVRTEALRWRAAHQRVRELDEGGQYLAAVAAALGTDPASSGATFDRLDVALRHALDQQRAAFGADATSARAALTWLAGGPAVLALLAGAASAAGVAIRVREYR